MHFFLFGGAPGPGRFGPRSFTQSQCVPGTCRHYKLQRFGGIWTGGVKLSEVRKALEGSGDSPCIWTVREVLEVKGIGGFFPTAVAEGPRPGFRELGLGKQVWELGLSGISCLVFQ